RRWPARSARRWRIRCGRRDGRRGRSRRSGGCARGPWWRRAPPTSTGGSWPRGSPARACRAGGGARHRRRAPRVVPRPAARDLLIAAALSAPLGVIRPEGCLVPFALGVILAVGALRARRLPWRAMLFGVIALVPIAAYSIVLYRVRGVILSGKWNHYRVVLG